MITVRLIGGLGNQLFQYTIGRMLAIQNRVPLQLDTSVYNHPDAKSYKLHYFNINAAIAKTKEVDRINNLYESNALYPKLFRSAERRFLPKYKWRYYKEAGYYQYDSQLMQVKSPVLLEGFWQHYKYYQNIHPAILQELTLREQYQTGAPPILSEIEQDIHAVSMHIRRGDYVSDPNNLNYFGVQPVSYYKKAMEYMKAHLKTPVFYVFSDDLNWVKANLNIDEQAVYVNMEGDKDYLELYAMSRCRHHIIANSSFSWWGAFLNKRPDKIVVAPAQWLADEEENKHVAIQLPEWIKM